MKRFLSVMLVCVLLFGVGSSLMPSPARAQSPILTNDLPNTAQNTISAVSEVQTTLTALDQLNNQIEQLKRQKQNLAKLDLRDWADFFQITLQVSRLVKDTLQAAGRWFEVARRIDNIWGKYGPVEYRDKPFYERLQNWEKRTNDALKFSIVTHSLVAQLHGLLHSQLMKIERKSKTVEGTVAAVELQTKTTVVIAHQLALVTDLAMKVIDVWHTEKLEERRRAEAARARQLDALGRGFGTHETAAPPVVLLDF